MKPLFEVKVIARFRGDPGEGGTCAHAIQDALYKGVDLYPELEVIDVVDIDRLPGGVACVSVLVGLYTIAKSEKKAFNIARRIIHKIAKEGPENIEFHDAHIVMKGEELCNGWDDVKIWQDPNKKQSELTHREYLDLYWRDIKGV